jgi:hypothetical protein
VAFIHFSASSTVSTNNLSSLLYNNTRVRVILIAAMSSLGPSPGGESLVDSVQRVTITSRAFATRIRTLEDKLIDCVSRAKLSRSRQIQMLTDITQYFSKLTSGTKLALEVRDDCVRWQSKLSLATDDSPATTSMSSSSSSSSSLPGVASSTVASSSDSSSPVATTTLSAGPSSFVGSAVYERIAESCRKSTERLMGHIEEQDDLFGKVKLALSELRLPPELSDDYIKITLGSVTLEFKAVAWLCSIINATIFRKSIHQQQETARKLLQELTEVNEDSSENLSQVKRYLLHISADPSTTTDDIQAWLALAVKIADDFISKIFPVPDPTSADRQ